MKHCARSNKITEQGIFQLGYGISELYFLKKILLMLE